jgi:LysM repeat protein
MINSFFFRIFLLCSSLLFLEPHSVKAASHRSTYESESEIVIRELRDHVDVLKHEVSNHESEIRSFEDKVRNQDATVEALRQQFEDIHNAQKEQIQDSTADLETRIKSLDSISKGLVADAKQLKERINETTTALTQATTVLTQFGQRLTKLEKGLETQTQNITSLEVALKSVLEAFQLKDNTTSITSTMGDNKIYRVKPGDSLGEIARQNNISIQVIKKLNQLTSDKIIVGQKLKLCD